MYANIVLPQYSLICRYNLTSVFHARIVIVHSQCLLVRNVGTSTRCLANYIPKSFYCMYELLDMFNLYLWFVRLTIE